MIGVCVPKDGSVSVAQVQEIGATWVRFTADRGYDQERYAKALHQAGLKVFITLDSDSLSGFASIDDMAIYYADVFTGWIDCIGIGNEAEGEGYESSVEGYDTLHAKALRLRAEFPRSVQIVGPGLVSGNPAWLDGFDLSLVDAIDVHLYASAPPRWPDAMTGYVDAKLQAYRDRLAMLGYPSMPIYMTEIGLSSDETGEAKQADYCRDILTWARQSELVCCCWFAYHPYNGWGLIRPDGSQKPSYAAFREAAGWQPSQMERDRQALLRTMAYVRSTPQKRIKRKKLLELLGAA